MQPLTPYEMFSLSAQPRQPTIAPTTDIATPVNTVLLTMICLPLIWFSSLIATTAYQQLRARLLKQQIMRLERARYVSHKAEEAN